MNLITELRQEWKTVVIITHEPEIANYAQRHILVKDGNIVNTLETWLEWAIEHDWKKIFSH
jgi:putative ABC transport system ATP-binding protein